jgi:hypothetical protein
VVVLSAGKPGWERNVKERLEAIETLKQNGLITEKE